MITILTIQRYVLRYPEPDMAGGGAAASLGAPAADAGDAGDGGDGGSPPDGGAAAASLWDEPASSSDIAADATPLAANDWAADYGAVEFASDEQRVMIDAIGKDLGLDAAQYGAVIGKLDSMMLEQNKLVAAADQEATLMTLKQSWGAAFEAKASQARGAFASLAKELGLSATQLNDQLPATPASMQLLQSYAAARSGSSAPVLGSFSKASSWFGDDSNELYQAYNNSSNPRYNEARDKRLAELSPVK